MGRRLRCNADTVSGIRTIIWLSAVSERLANPQFLAIDSIGFARVPGRDLPTEFCMSPLRTPRRGRHSVSQGAWPTDLKGSGGTSDISQLRTGVRLHSLALANHFTPSRRSAGIIRSYPIWVRDAANASRSPQIAVPNVCRPVQVSAPDSTLLVHRRVGPTRVRRLLPRHQPQVPCRLGKTPMR